MCQMNGLWVIYILILNKRQVLKAIKTFNFYDNMYTCNSLKMLESARKLLEMFTARLGLVRIFFFKELNHSNMLGSSSIFPARIAIIAITIKALALW